MGLITLTQISNGNDGDATTVDNNFDTVANVVNGNLSDANISSSAGISREKLAAGALGYAEVTANQTGIVGAVVDLTSLTVSVTVPTGGRRLKITGKVQYQTTIAGDTASVYIAEGANVFNTWAQNLPTAGVSDSLAAIASFTATAGTHTYKLQGIRVAGTGSITMQASGTVPAFILVEIL